MTVFAKQDSEKNYAKAAQFYIPLDTDIPYFNCKVIWHAQNTLLEYLLVCLPSSQLMVKEMVYIQTNKKTISYGK